MRRRCANDCYDFWHSPRPRQVINHAKFCFGHFKDFGPRKGQSFGSPIGNRNGPVHTGDRHKSKQVTAKTIESKISLCNVYIKIKAADLYT